MKDNNDTDAPQQLTKTVKTEKEAQAAASETEKSKTESNTQKTGQAQQVG